MEQSPPSFVALAKKQVKEFTGRMYTYFKLNETPFEAVSPEGFISWIREELAEYQVARNSHNIVMEIDAVVDIMYFILDYSYRAHIHVNSETTHDFYRHLDWKVIEVGDIITCLEEGSTQISDVLINGLFHLCHGWFKMYLPRVEDQIAVFGIVHESNMRKFKEGAKFDKERKKLIKPPDHIAPDAEIREYLLGKFV